MVFGQVRFLPKLLTKILIMNNLFVEKKNISTNELIEILKYQNERKFDINVTPSKIDIKEGRLIIKDVIDTRKNKEQKFKFELSKTAIADFCSRFSISAKYRDKMLKDNPELMYRNIKSWINYEAFNGDKPFLIRAFLNEPNKTKGIMRCLRSGQYRFYENLETILHVISAVQKVEKDRQISIQVKDCSISEHKMFIRFVCPEIEQESHALANYVDPTTGNRGKGIFTGFIVSNSETGRGGLNVAPRLIVGACSNGMIWTNEAYRKSHRGSKMPLGMVNWDSDTIKAQNKAILAEISNSINVWLSSDYLGKKVEQIEDLANLKLDKPVAVLKAAASEFGFSDEDQENLLNSFIKGGSTDSAFDIVQAFTHHAQSKSEIERYDLESKAMGINYAKLDQKIGQ